MRESHANFFFRLSLAIEGLRPPAGLSPNASDQTPIDPQPSQYDSPFSKSDRTAFFGQWKIFSYFSTGQDPQS
jgi:hypothetical protein